MNTISLIIPNLNGLHFLKPCLESIRRQTRAPDEILIVDNGSTDGSQAFLQQEYTDVSILELGHNTGFSVAMNRAVEAVSGDYVALLNNDTECEPQWLEKLAYALDQHPDIGFCAAKMMHFNRRQIIDTAGDMFSIAGFAFKRGGLHIDQEQYNRPERVFGACAGAAMYRKSVFDDLGGFDEDFFIYQEDSDLSFRAQLAGFPCLFVPKAVVYHHVGGTSKQSSTAFSRRLKRLEHRNLIFILVKNLPGSLWFRYGLWIILAHFALFLMQASKGFGIATLQGYVDAIRGLG
ncbi:MAG: glycosyltransferase family 2 protein, partial [Gammaproteobacteria bacterium]|nr:glycosyltransferase family 2 protein [Gammaproteobacteria bacterium]